MFVLRSSRSNLNTRLVNILTIKNQDFKELKESDGYEKQKRCVNSS